MKKALDRIKKENEVFTNLVLKPLANNIKENKVFNPTKKEGK